MLLQWRRIALAVAVLLFGGIAVVFAKFSPITSSDWASWIQAFGSIFALGVAIYVPWQQRRDAESADARRVYRELASVALDVSAFLSSLDTVVRFGQRGDREYVVDEVEFEELLHRITWCRQQIVLSKSLPHILQLRESLVRAASVVRRHGYPAITAKKDESDLVAECLQKVSSVLNEVLELDVNDLR
ncbi:hypothetical protein [Cupriavidus sp.]|uniref:hypothetical protein n=1 Tax=Cupriavidus sp. TaxID=1873897 RepID=UPI0028BE1C3C|nr:hypothetical protein [Cupriavidus sp.]